MKMSEWCKKKMEEAKDGEEAYHLKIVLTLRGMKSKIEKARWLMESS